MKVVSRILLLLLIPLAATFAFAQTLPHFQHIIIVVQENRTPDNLFGAGGASIGATCGSPNPFMPGVDIDNGGANNRPGVPNPTCNMQLPLNGWDAEIDGATHNPIGIINPDHTYAPGFVADYDYYNNMRHQDGFCHEHVYSATHPCPYYSYAAASDVQPYFFIAENYGFANYMFQTGEGASYTSHQFLFTGTSAPVAPGQDHSLGYDLDFVADYTRVGCEHAGSGPDWVYPNGTELSDPLQSTCYTHDTLVTAATACNPNGYCDRGISWGYYGPSAFAQWNAPQEFPQTCYGKTTRPNLPPITCPTTLGHEYADHVHLPGSPIPWNTPAKYSDAPIFDDLYGCQLPAISWVIPDGRWSDHTWIHDTQNSKALGPDWVGDIINGVGQACGGKYWSGVGSEPTAVIVTWDDWGGWFDHIAPWAYYRGTSSTCPNAPPPQGAPNGWGCGYVAGFRVPLLVVSPYTGQSDGKGGVTGWVSGACSGASCPNFGLSNVYVHDFGSILAFTEWNFNFQPRFIAQPGYADYNAPDWGGNPLGSYIPLSDFFTWTPARQFVPVPTAYDHTCFQQVGKCFDTSPYQPEDPDDY